MIETIFWFLVSCFCLVWPSPGIVLLCFLIFTRITTIFLSKFMTEIKLLPIVVFILYVGGVLVIIIYLVRLSADRPDKAKFNIFFIFFIFFIFQFEGRGILLNNQGPKMVFFFCTRNVFFFCTRLVVLSLLLYLLSRIIRTQKKPIRIL